MRNLVDGLQIRRGTLAIMFGVLLLVSAFWSSEARSEYLKVSDDLTIFYKEAGNKDGIPVVFTPGWTLTSETFVRQLSHYAKSDRYRFIAYDPRGHGLSTKTAEGHTYEQQGRDLKAFMDKLGLKNAVIGGHSYGFLTVMTYIDQFGTDNVRGVVVLDSTPKSVGADNSTEWVWFRHDDSDGFRKFFTMGPLEDRAAFNIEFAKWMIEDQSPENLAWIDAISNGTSNTVAALLNETGAYVDLTKTLIALEGKVPLFYVIREDWKDIVPPWVAKNTPSADITVFGKHMMFWERASEFNAALDKFLAKLK